MNKKFETILSLIIFCFLGVVMLKKISRVFKSQDLDAQNELNEWANELIKNWLSESKQQFLDSKFISSKFIFEKQDTKSCICSFEAIIQKDTKDNFLKAKAKQNLNWEQIPDEIRASFIRSSEKDSIIEVDFNFEG